MGNGASNVTAVGIEKGVSFLQGIARCSLGYGTP
jgi:hypothetical protein